MKMMKLKKCLAVALAAMSLCLAVGCNESEEKADIGTPPDYSEAQGQMDFYGYHSISNGQYTIDGVLYDCGEDFRTVERFKEYLDCGMNMVFLQGPGGSFNGNSAEDWEKSTVKEYLNMFLEAGTNRVIFQDEALYNLSAYELKATDQAAKKEWEDNREEGDETPYNPLIANENTKSIDKVNRRFETQEEFEEYVAGRLALYADHEAFYGLLLRDEPSWKQFDACAAVYKAIKKYDESIFVKQNLYPLSTSPYANYAENYNQLTVQEAYDSYLRTWQSMTGADYIMYDDYPIADSGIGGYHIAGLKLVADLCKEKDLSLYVVAQAMEMLVRNQPANRACTKADMYWQLNMLQGFGVKRIAYFTYWRRRTSNTNGEFFVDGASFLTSAGEKTDLYYYMTDIHKEIQNFAPTLLSFEYNACAYYMQTPMAFPVGYLGGIENEEMTCIEKVSVAQSDLLLVTELIDEDKGNYMYMLQNIMDPAKGLVGDTVVNAEVEFDEKYNYVAVWYKGNVTYHKLNNHKYTTELSAGYAEFVIPYV